MGFMKPAPFSPRSFFIATLTAIVVLTVVGWVFWSLSALQYRRIIDGWIDEGRAAGYQISYADRQIFGFPRRLTMRLVDVHWRDADGIDFRADDMDIIASPWDWHSFDAKFKNHVSLAAPLDVNDHALMLSCGAGRAQVKLDADGVWHAAKLSLDDTTLGLTPNYLFQAERLNAAATRPDVLPKDHTEVGLTLEGDAADITLPDAMPSPFGAKAAKITVHMRVMGKVPDVRRRDAVDAWNKDSGIVEFDDLSMTWGILALTSKGTLGFDDDLQPEGAFAGTIGNPQKTMQALMDSGFIAMHDAGMLASAMQLFAKPSVRGTQGLELPITIQLGGLFFGPIRIFTFPEIEWPVEPPKNP
jgi:hypothetical protein